MTVRGLSHRRVIIVGAGQAGLAVAAALKNEGLVPQRDFTVIDANTHGQRSWATRWHSMLLLSDASHSAISAWPFPGDQSRHPRVDEMEEYLAAVESALGVATMWGIRANGVDRVGSGSTLMLSTTEGPVQTRNVVCATGSAAQPRVPGWAARLDIAGPVLHSAQYSFPRQIPQGDVLIIGDGVSGLQIAQELVHSHVVTLSTRARATVDARRLPHTRRPVSSAWSMTRRKKLRREADHAELRQRGVTIASAAVETNGPEVLFEDGARTAPRSVIFATGYVPGDTWLPQSFRDGAPGRRLRGATALPGLFVTGIPGYSRPGADSLAGVARDATAIARQIMNRP